MFVVSDQRLTGLIAPITPFYGSQGNEWLGLGHGTLSTYSDIYRKQPAVRSVVDFLAGHLARMSFKVMQKESPVLDTQLYDHPAQALLNDPNRWRSSTNWWRDFWLDWLIYDRFGAVKINDPVNGGTFQLVRLPPVWFTPFGQNYWHPTSLRIMGNRGFGDFPIEQCLYVHGYDPIDPRIGISPMETMRTILEEEAASQTWRQRFWDGNAQPSMIITRPLDAPEWTDPARDRFIESLRSAANRGKPLLLEEGMTSNLNDGQFSPQTAQYIESKRFTREEVLRFYGLPIGLFETQGFSSVLQYRQYLYSEVLAGLLQRAADELTSQVLPEWWVTPRAKGIRAAAGIEEAIRGSLAEQVAVLKDAVGVPFLTREEARTFVSLPTGETDMSKLALPVNYTVEGESGVRESVTDSTDKPPPGAGGTGGKPDNPATAQGGNNVGDNGKPEIGPYSPKAAKPDGAKALSAAKTKSVLAARDRFAKQFTGVISRAVDKQARSVKSRGKAAFDRDKWDKELAQDLLGVSLAAATFFGTDAADEIGGEYDEDRTVNYLRANSKIVASRLNASTADRLAEGDPADDVFKAAKDGAIMSGLTRATSMMNFGIHEAASQNEAQKTWNVTSGSPRPSHADMDGETVSFEDEFSNGLRFPGDSENGSVDEVAGCTCVLTVTR